MSKISQKVINGIRLAHSSVVIACNNITLLLAPLGMIFAGYFVVNFVNSKFSRSPSFPVALVCSTAVIMMCTYTLQRLTHNNITFTSTSQPASKKLFWAIFWFALITDFPFMLLTAVASIIFTCVLGSQIPSIVIIIITLILLKFMIFFVAPILAYHYFIAHESVGIKTALKQNFAFIKNNFIETFTAYIYLLCLSTLACVAITYPLGLIIMNQFGESVFVSALEGSIIDMAPQSILLAILASLMYLQAIRKHSNLTM